MTIFSSKDFMPEILCFHKFFGPEPKEVYLLLFLPRPWIKKCGQWGHFSALACGILKGLCSKSLSLGLPVCLSVCLSASLMWGSGLC